MAFVAFDLVDGGLPGGLTLDVGSALVAVPPLGVNFGLRIFERQESVGVEAPVVQPPAESSPRGVVGRLAGAIEVKLDAAFVCPLVSQAMVQ
jgi:hypothetical protein